MGNVPRMSLLDEAIAEARREGARGMARLSLTDDHEVCDNEKREAVAAERRATVERIRGQVDGEAFRAGLTPAAMLVLDRISVVLDMEAAR